VSGPYFDLLHRCEQRAIEIDDRYLLALSRWLCSMTLDTSRELLSRSRAAGERYATALATVRLAMDTARQDPDHAEQALLDADTIAVQYASQYIRDFAVVARGVREIIVGDVATIIDAGRRLATNPTAAMQANRRRLLTIGGLLARDPTAVAEAVVSADDRRLAVNQEAQWTSTMRWL